MRITGLSGVGKTRLAIEALRDCDFARDRVVYVDTQICKTFSPGSLQTWIERDLSGTLVVDNCDLRTHQLLVDQVTRSESKFALLTMHLEPDAKYDDSSAFFLSPMQDKYISEILEPIYRNRILDFDRVVEFAQGFPKMAVLLAKARLAQSKEIGKLDDDVMLDKLLGDQAKINQERKILSACALFDKFGLVDGASEEYKFVASQIANVESDTLYECVARQAKRGIVGRFGRYAQVVPKPFAIRLAADWWDTTSPDKISGLLETEMPGQLEDSFCNQVSKLDFLPRAKQLAAKLCGEQSPFGRAEVILSDRGSRLFRYFVEVNPVITANSIRRAIGTLSDAKLLNMVGATRRNLVVSLEKLCFREETFETAGWSLMRLAMNESESWSNNATGLFKQLFRVFVSGTSAPPKVRLRLIDSVLALNMDASRILAIKTLSSALGSHGPGRLVGAEFQGSSTTLEEWRPEIWQDAFDYWVQIIKRLTQLALNDSPQRSLAKAELGKNIRFLVLSSRFIVDSLDEAIHKVVSSSEPLWVEALESITYTLEAIDDDTPAHAVDKLREWYQLLQPIKLEEKLFLYVTYAFYDYRKSVEGDYIDNATTNVEILAKELSTEIESLLPHVPRLLETEQRQGFHFGRTFTTHANEWDRVFDCAVDFVRKHSDAHIGFLCGMLAGIHDISPANWCIHLDSFSEDRDLVLYYPEFLKTGLINPSHLKTLVEKLRTKSFDVDALASLSQCLSMSSLPARLVDSFLLDVSHHSPRARWVALDLLTMYCHGEDTHQNHSNVFRRLSLAIPSFWDHRSSSSIDSHNWKEAVFKVLSWNGDREFAVSITKRILMLLAEGNYTETTYVFDPILRRVLDLYPQETWLEISAFIETANSAERFCLRELFRCEELIEREHRVSLYSEVPENLIEDWCRNSPEIAPMFVAETTEVFQTDGKTFSLAPRVEFLLDNFGKVDSMLDALRANLDTFSWKGSAIKHYKREISILRKLEEHSELEVRNWAFGRIERLKERIEYEEMIEQERSIGLIDRG